MHSTLGYRICAGAATWSLLLLSGLVPTLADGGEVIDLLHYDAYARLSSTSLFDSLGFAVAHCDFNGDGMSDVVVTAPYADGINGQREGAGEAYLVLGRLGAWSGAAPIVSEARLRIIGEDPFDSFGTSVACADVNGDGFDDILVGAQNADSAGNSRPNAGEVHLIFGSPNPPLQIDLATDAAPVIYGFITNGYLGDTSALAAGDLNGDGRADIVCSHPFGTRPLDGQIVGQTYVLFGRTQWPAQIDLLAGADLVLYGERAGSELGTSMRVIPLDTDDSIGELIVGASVGDGPGGSRQDAGDVFLFTGRTSWPQSIDLSTSTASLRFYGADAFDSLGRSQGIESGDFDADGTRELWLSTTLADGAANSLSSAGEVRMFELVAGRPTVVDMRDWTDWVLYGGKFRDRLGFAARGGDFNGDGVQDLATSAYEGDGPDELRASAGEILAFWGPRQFPAVLEEPGAVKDLLVYGAERSDGLTLFTVSDLNFDGIDELVGSIRTSDILKPAKLVVISHVDSDGDGVLQLDDNCPLVANLLQTDTDLDRVGDACDGDYDGDGLPDTNDCQLNRASAGLPPEVTGNRFELTSKSKIVWDTMPFADVYDVSRGDVTSLALRDYGSCMNGADPDLTDTQLVDSAVPGPSTAWFYLVRARDLECPATGSWGQTSVGTERINQSANSCP